MREHLPAAATGLELLGEALGGLANFHHSFSLLPVVRERAQESPGHPVLAQYVYASTHRFK
jgi:hypothetical protein